MTHYCPICGSPHDTEGGVVQHICRKGDDEHDYDRGDAWLLVRGNNESPADGSEENNSGGTEEPPSESPNNGLTNGEPSDPAKESPPDGSDGSQNGSNAGGDSTVDCPNCGSALSRESVMSTIQEHGAAQCPECDHSSTIF